MICCACCALFQTLCKASLPLTKSHLEPNVHRMREQGCVLGRRGLGFIILSDLSSVSYKTEIIWVLEPRFPFL